MSPKIYAGLDSGSRTTKLVFIDEEGIRAKLIEPTGIDPASTASEMLSKLIKSSGTAKKDISFTVATGYGKKITSLAEAEISEISCHARGISFFLPDARTFIDIGGQDSKVAVLNNRGAVDDFAMNDKCAAGTGRFLEVVARIFSTTVDRLGEIAAAASETVEINSTCVVFAESEIIGLLSQQHRSPDIVKSVHKSIARRTRNLMSSLLWHKPVAFTGGVARNRAMVLALEELLDLELMIPEWPEFTGAVGAALFARERYDKDN